MADMKELLPMYRRLLSFVRPYRGRLIGGIVFGVLYGPANVAVLAVVKRVWARFFEQGIGEMPGRPIVPVAMLARGLCDFTGTYLMNWVGLRAVMDLRVKMFEHLQKLSVDFYTGTRAGELISRVTNDAGLVQVAISNVIEDIVKEPVTLVCVLGWLLYTDWKLTVAGLVLFPVCLVPIVVYGRKTRNASRAAQEHQASLLTVLHEAIAGLRVIKAFSMEERETEDFRELNRNFFRQRMRVVRSKAVSTPMIELVAGLGGALVFLYACFAGLEGSKLIAFGLGLFMLYAPVKKISRVQLQIQESLGGAERIFQLLDVQPSVVKSPTAKTLPRFRRSIRLESVTFNYEQPNRGNVLAVGDS